MLSCCGTDFMHSEPGRSCGALGWESSPVLGLCPRGRHCSSVRTTPKSGLLPMVTSEIPENS